MNMGSGMPKQNSFNGNGSFNSNNSGSMGSRHGSSMQPYSSQTLSQGAGTSSQVGLGNSFSKDRPSFLQEDDAATLKRRVQELELENKNLKGGQAGDSFTSGGGSNWSNFGGSGPVQRPQQMERPMTASGQN